MLSLASSALVPRVDWLRLGGLAFDLFDPKWIPKFFAAFFPAFLSSGILFGMLYVLGMRAIRANRREVEAWFEQQRLRLQAGPMPIVEKSQPVMQAALTAIYGRTAWERLRASFLIGLFFTGVVFGAVYLEYRRLPAHLHEKMTQVEREADPMLFSYVTDATLNREYQKAWEGREFVYQHASYKDYTYKDPLYEELRSRRKAYQAHFFERLSADPGRVPLTLIYLMQGHRVDPGFQRSSTFQLFLFNVVTDFVSATIVLLCVRRLGKSFTVMNASMMFLFATAGTSICLFIASFSYHGFFCGQTEYFIKILFILPGTLICALLGLFALWSIIEPSDPKGAESGRSDLLQGLTVACLVFPLSLAGYFHLRDYWEVVSFRFNDWKEVFAFPYVLAAVTLVPAILTIIAFGLMLAAKFTAEPARVLPESYMTFVKEEVGGSQVAGLTLIVGTVAGVIAGLIGLATN